MTIEKTECVSHNDQVNRAEAIASTEAQNTDAASVVPTSESVDGGSGSTPCSLRFLASNTPAEVWFAIALFVNCFFFLGSSWYRGLFAPFIEPIFNCFD